MRSYASAAALLLSSALASPTIESRSAQCTDFIIPVTAKASNYDVFDPTHNLTTVDGITSFLGSAAGALGELTSFIPQFGTYNISARYCAPQANPSAPASRAKHVQVLLHGIPYDKNYWSGLQFGSDQGHQYSWFDYATSRGYPVLAIDNIGSGNSSRAEPTVTVQQPLETEILHQIMLMARAGTLSHVPKAEKLIFVGHSIGSVIGNGLAYLHPDDSFDAAILTGYTHTVAQSLIGVLGDGIEPATLQNFKRFGILDPGYLTFASVEGKRNTYYSADGEFDAALPAYDVNEKQGTVSDGELLTIFSGLQRAPKYTGDIFVITGNQDAIFCGPGSRAIAVPDCGSGADSLPAKTKDFWPNANYQYYIPVGGHAITLHHSSQEQFQKAHDFLAGSGY